MAAEDIYGKLQEFLVENLCQNLLLLKFIPNWIDEKILHWCSQALQCEDSWPRRWSWSRPWSWSPFLWPAPLIQATHQESLLESWLSSCLESCSPKISVNPETEHHLYKCISLTVPLAATWVFTFDTFALNLTLKFGNSSTSEYSITASEVRVREFSPDTTGFVSLRSSLGLRGPILNFLLIVWSLSATEAIFRSSSSSPIICKCE